MTDQPDRRSDYGAGGPDPQGTGATDRNTAGAVFDDRFKAAVSREEQAVASGERDLAQEASRDTTQASAGLAGGGDDLGVTAGGLGGTQAGAGAADTIGSGDPNAADRQGDIAADDAGASAAVGDQIAIQGQDPVA